jgi:hypothetical protein
VVAELAQRPSANAAARAPDSTGRAGSTDGDRQRARASFSSHRPASADARMTSLCDSLFIATLSTSNACGARARPSLRGGGLDVIADRPCAARLRAAAAWLVVAELSERGHDAAAGLRGFTLVRRAAHHAAVAMPPRARLVLHGPERVAGRPPSARLSRSRVHDFASSAASMRPATSSSFLSW